MPLSSAAAPSSTTPAPTPPTPAKVTSASPTAVLKVRRVAIPHQFPAGLLILIPITEDECNAAASAKKLRKLRKLRARQANLDFGSCTNPAIEFAAGLDGRKEESFAPADSADFNHGSALNIKVISGFICGQLQSKCKAGDDAVTACNDAASAADAETGQAAADAFNSALGVSA